MKPFVEFGGVCFFIDEKEEGACRLSLVELTSWRKRGKKASRTFFLCCCSVLARFGWFFLLVRDPFSQFFCSAFKPCKKSLQPQFTHSTLEFKHSYWLKMVTWLEAANQNASILALSKLRLNIFLLDWIWVFFYSLQSYGWLFALFFVKFWSL